MIQSLNGVPVYQFAASNFVVTIEQHSPWLKFVHGRVTQGSVCTRAIRGIFSVSKLGLLVSKFVSVCQLDAEAMKPLVRMGSPWSQIHFFTVAC